MFITFLKLWFNRDNQTLLKEMESDVLKEGSYWLFEQYISLFDIKPNKASLRRVLDFFIDEGLYLQARHMKEECFEDEKFSFQELLRILKKAMPGTIDHKLATYNLISRFIKLPPEAVNLLDNLDAMTPEPPIPLIKVYRGGEDVKEIY
jgi:hypothetical protein